MEFLTTMALTPYYKTFQLSDGSFVNIQFLDTAGGERYNAIKSDCINYLYPEEPKTCRDNELRKWYYFYENPKEYLLYRNEPQVMDYLVQQDYPTYTSNSYVNSTSLVTLNEIPLSSE